MTSLIVLIDSNAWPVLAEVRGADLDQSPVWNLNAVSRAAVT